MLPENRIPTHPGEILLEEFLNPLGLSQVAFAGHIGVPVHNNLGVALKDQGLFAEAFGTTPEFWLNLQTNYDLVRYRPKRQVARIAAPA